MPLLETVIIEVSAAISKSIVKLWVKDSSLGTDISTGLIDILKSHTSDALVQRRGQRQFEAIGDKVCEQLLPLFEIEGAGINENGRTAVARKVAEAFEQARLTIDELISCNYEPTLIAQHVLKALRGATRDFSAAEAALYERVINEACVYIVSIIRQLPTFKERTFIEILRRENYIQAKAEAILNELIEMRQELDPKEENQRFEIDYREAITRKLSILNLIGADISPSSRRHQLNIAYIPLSVEQTLLARSDKQPKIGDRVPNIVSIDKIMKGSYRLLIQGPAGSGKTTLLQWIAIKAATKSFDEALADWNKCLPFFIRLRQCMQSGLPRPEEFPQLITPAIAGTMPRGWVHTVLKEGRAVVLVDGVDEVPALQREEVRIWLKDLVDSYQQVRFIVTSRPHAVEEGWMDSEAFHNAELQPMELTDIYSFIEHWHNAVREELSTDEEKRELGKCAEQLKGQVSRTKALRNLATNPLLCAMLCALNRDRRHRLPVNRIELYQASCSMLLERRDRENHIDLSDYPSLSYGQKLRLLQDLAYMMLQKNISEAPIEIVDKRFTHKLTDMPSVSQEITGKRVREYFVERTGMVREPVAGRIDFTHRTFQEFFAAQAIVDIKDIEGLVSHAHDDQWRDVIILTAGLAPKDICEKLISDLIDRGDREKQYRYQLHLTAVACLETAVELRLEIKAEVEKRLSKLVPPKDLTEAKAISAAGELSVKHLMKNKKFSSQTSALCVHALANVGGEEALEALEEYAEDSDEVVINELLKSWDAFDRDSYARRVLRQALRNKVELRLERLSSIVGIQYISNIRKLELLDSPQLQDLTPLASLGNLTSLNLSGCNQIGSLSFAELPSLKALALSGCAQLKTINLKNLGLLSELKLPSPSRLIELSLTSLHSLLRLNMSACTQLSSLTLTNLDCLTELNLFECAQLHQVSLTGLNHLTKLALPFRSQISSINLTELDGLTELNFSGRTQLNNLSLTRLNQLTKLNVSGCNQLRSLNLTGLVSLTKLDISVCTKLTDLNVLCGLDSLVLLTLSHDMAGITLPPEVKARVDIKYI